MDKELLFKPRLKEDEVLIEGIGVVRVRELNRDESLLVGGMDEGWAAKERKLVSLGCVDPVLTEDEVGQWQKASGNGELDAVSGRIAELSGMTDGAAKEAYKSV